MNAPRTAIRTDDSAIVRKGGLVVFGALGAFLLWATLSPISSAVIASGELVSNGRNKLVQHRFGGRVDAIRAQDGDRVQRGDVIVELDARDARAALSTLQARYERLAASRNRLLAEKGDRSPATIALSAKNTLRGSQPAGLAGTLQQEQRNELRFGGRRRKAEAQGARARIQALEERASGLRDRLSRREAARGRVLARMKRMRPLVREGYVARARLWELEERLDREDSARDEAAARLKETREEIAQARAEQERLAAGTGERAAQELTAALASMAELDDQILAARSRLDLLVVRAPAAGIVTGLQANTVGGVVPPGGTIATIVPLGGRTRLVVEARLRASDVDNVSVGQDAEIVLAAFSRRKVEPLPGRVTYVAADRADPGQATGRPAAAPGAGGFYTVRVAFEGELNADLAAKLRSGMPADAFIRAEPRTLLAYLTDPLTDSLARAFRDPD